MHTATEECRGLKQHISVCCPGQRSNELSWFIRKTVSSIRLKFSPFHLPFTREKNLIPEENVYSQGNLCINGRLLGGPVAQMDRASGS
jgi:hypothetical protein